MTITADIHDFDALTAGCSAPAWLDEALRESYGLRDADYTIRLITVSENATFVVKKAGVPHSIIRLQRPGYISGTASIESELAWVAAIKQDTSIPTPAPHKNLSGGYVTTMTSPAGAQWVGVSFGYAPGTVLEDLNAPPGVFETVGQLTGALHSHQEGWERPPFFDRFSWTIPDMVGPDCRWGMWEYAKLTVDQARTLSDAQAKAIAVIEDIPETAKKWGLIHADLRPSNILVDPEDLKAVTVIDFDDCGSSWLLYDFASALTHYEHRPEAKEMARAWLSGYQTVRQLSDTEKTFANALSMIRRLQMLGWLTTHRPDSIPSDLYEESIPGAVYCSEQYLANSRWLVDGA